MSALSPQQPRKSATGARRFRSPEHGFTLVELMVVLVIIAIVAGLIIVGITSAMSGTRDDATETRMQMLDGFMEAYANADNARTGGMGNTEAKRLPEVLKAIPTSTVFYSTIDSVAYDTTPSGTAGEPLTAPDPSATLPYVGSDPGRFPARFVQDNWIVEPAVARTQAVMRALLRVPANQSTYASVSEDAKTLVTAVGYDTGSGAEPALVAYQPGTTDAGSLDPPLLVDGHGNVIIYVPSTGLTGLRFADGTTLDLANTPGQRRLIAANGRAFWASAGADGDFSTGDDNVYSTQVMRDKSAASAPPIP